MSQKRTCVDVTKVLSETIRTHRNKILDLIKTLDDVRFCPRGSLTPVGFFHLHTVFKYLMSAWRDIDWIGEEPTEEYVPTRKWTLKAAKPEMDNAKNQLKRIALVIGGTLDELEDEARQFFCFSEKLFTDTERSYVTHAAACLRESKTLLALLNKDHYHEHEATIAIRDGTSVGSLASSLAVEANGNLVIVGRGLRAVAEAVEVD